MAQNKSQNVVVTAGQKHKMCQDYLLRHPEVVSKYLFNGHGREYSACVFTEYCIVDDSWHGLPPKLDALAVLRKGDYVELVPIEIKGNTDDRRRIHAKRDLKRYLMYMEGKKANEFISGKPIVRGLIFQGYERENSEEPTFRITQVPF